MRNLLYFLFCCALFCSCKKQSDRNCQLTSVQSGDISPTITTYEYDQQGRIVKVTVTSVPISLTYYSDSIVVDNASWIITYNIASSGLATTSKIRFLFPNPNQMTSEDNYTYDAEGYLIQARNISSQLVNGITIRDTFNARFTIQNGNITEYWSNNVKIGAYEYTNLIAKENMAFTTHPIYQWPFLGRFSKNLMSSMTSSNGPSTFEYEFDDEKNIIKRKEFKGLPGPAISYYNYLCD